MVRIPIAVDFPRDLDRPVEAIVPQGTVADRRERFVTQIRFEDSQARAYVGNEPQQSACARSASLLLASDGKTIDGKWEFDVRPALCDGHLGPFGEPSLCASCLNANPPIIASIGYYLSADGTQLVLRVFTATGNGDPKDTYFQWQAVIPFLAPPLI